MTKIGIFIPIASRGWLMSTTAPKTNPTFDLNRTLVQRAEHYNFDFALSMVKMRGFEGPSEYWASSLESFTLMAGLAAVTKKIDLFASIALLTIPPALAARMAVTIDSIAPGRFGVNIVTGWQPKEYQQMGLWPGEEHFSRRYEYATEYVSVLKDLWEEGVSNFRGEYFQMDDCRLSPRPSAKIPIVAANSSDRGQKFVADFCDYNFVGIGNFINEPERAHENVGRLMTNSSVSGRKVGALCVVMVIAAETDEAAFARYEHYRKGTDLVAQHDLKNQSGADAKGAANSMASVIKEAMSASLKDAGEAHPTAIHRFIGSYERVAQMLDTVADVPGISGIMLTFDDFVSGLEQFGEHIQPLMRSRNGQGVQG